MRSESETDARRRSIRRLDRKGEGNASACSKHGVSRPRTGFGQAAWEKKSPRKKLGGKYADQTRIDPPFA